tara:strand:+ start:3219 stop:3608 length:390 start_codon:yes stop_codon:yes gene_type:complete
MAFNNRQTLTGDYVHVAKGGKIMGELEVEKLKLTSFGPAGVFGDVTTIDIKSEPTDTVPQVAVGETGHLNIQKHQLIYVKPYTDYGPGTGTSAVPVEGKFFVSTVAGPATFGFTAVTGSLATTDIVTDS